MKQQKQIRLFLEDKFERESAEKMFIREERILENLIRNTSGKTDNQMKTLISTILPRVALYKTLTENKNLSSQEVWEIMRSYMLDVVASKQHASRVRMEKFPGFYWIFSKIFLRIMKTTDLQKSTQKEDRDFYNINITDCLWHNACVENGCPELCRLFCDVDDVTYGGLKKIGFNRTQTLGYGGTCCDFHFYRK